MELGSLFIPDEVFAQQWREVEAFLAAVGIQECPATRLKIRPATPRQGRCAANLTKETVPFELGAFDVAGPERDGEELAAIRAGLGKFAHHIARAIAETHRHAKLQIALELESVIGLRGDESEASAVRGIVAGETMSGANIGHVVEEIVECVIGFFQGGGNGETFAVREKTEDLAALRRSSIGFDEAELAPGHRWRIGGVERFAIGLMRAGLANGGKFASCWRIDQDVAETVEESSDGRIGEGKLGDNEIAAQDGRLRFSGGKFRDKWPDDFVERFFIKSTGFPQTALAQEFADGLGWLVYAIGDGGDGDFASVCFGWTANEFAEVSGAEIGEGFWLREGWEPALAALNEGAIQRECTGTRLNFPLAVAVQHFHVETANEPGAFGIGA